jgi:LuxR family transcriptional regulator, regulator of acetate metabolism
VAIGKQAMTRSLPLDAACFAALLRSLSDVGPPSEICNRSPGFAASTLAMDRVLLTSLDNGRLIAEALHVEGVRRPSRILSRLQENAAPLDYPVLEGEIMRRRRAQVVRTAPENGTRHVFAEILDWTDYVAAPIVLDGSVVGFFHADRARNGVDETDADMLGVFATCFALVYERAVLRHRLRVQRHEMREVASWADARASELGDRAITLREPDQKDPQTTSAARPTGVGENTLRQLLTPREFEVLKLIVRGDTNVAIAKKLVLSEGTVKFHVKNILRKLHASNRAEATSRYMKLALDNRARTVT